MIKVYCDKCGKEIKHTETISIRISHSKWDEPEKRTGIEKDLCTSCANIIIQRIREIL